MKARKRKRIQLFNLCAKVLQAVGGLFDMHNPLPG